MSRLLALILNWFARTIGLLLVIVALLMFGSWLRSEWSELRAMRAEIDRQQQVLTSLRAELVSLDEAIATDAAAWRTQIDRATEPLREELESLRARTNRAEPRWQEALRRFADLEKQAREARRAADEAQASVARLEQGLRWWDRYLSPGKVVALQNARARAALLQANARSWESARDKVAPAIESSPLAALFARRSRLETEIDNLSQATSPRYAELESARKRRVQEVAVLEDVLARQRERVARDPRERLVAEVRQWLPPALAILAAVLLAPLLVKAVAYYLLAPLAGRLPPIRILPATSPAPATAPVVSAVSVALDIAADQELLVHPDFLQSSSEQAGKRTQWLLNASLPFASLASGMFALTRIRPPSGAATRVVVSSQQDAFGEVGVIDLPAGAAMVVQPRSLAGVVKSAGTALDVTRHWRIASLHAWLTLQFRYLVFHGPCRLIVKGCRGVRAEHPDPAQARTINQAATLAFSANLDYRVTRCETFISYLRGKQDLFNDLFSGGPGQFVYEELPAGGRPTRGIGRGLEGIVDAVLKALGI
jgi:uncharacterized protein (AIM24 family)